MPSERFDTLRTVGTPEGVWLDLRLAGPVPRALAWLIDLAIRAGLYIGAGVVFSPLGDTGTGLFLLLLFVTEWFYPVLFELLNRGATPGKSAMALQVVMDDGTPVRLSASLVRNLLRAADLLPFGYLAGLVSMTLSPSFQRLGDIAAGTVVIHRLSREAASPRFAVTPQAPPVSLSPEEQRAVIDFAERSRGWTPERAAELASLAPPLVAGVKPGAPRVERLRALAAWFVGER